MIQLCDDGQPRQRLAFLDFKLAERLFETARIVGKALGAT